MAVYTIGGIVRDVRVALDQNVSGGQLSGFGDADTLSVDEIIRSKIADSVRRIHGNAPLYMLEGTSFGDSINWEKEGCGWVLLPDDFMRLVVFEMSDWSRAVYDAITPDDPQYRIQQSKFVGVRGNASNPVCALCLRPEGKVLEFYSSNDSRAHISRALYMPHPKVDAYGGIDISPRCYDAVVYMAASLAASAMGEKERSAELASQSASSLV
jgi:hypothetical protein